ncbi:MAG: hypothetical protein ACI4QE_01215, partial [Acutalibacteraceae bacterium]
MPDKFRAISYKVKSTHDFESRVARHPISRKKVDVFKTSLPERFLRRKGDVKRVSLPDKFRAIFYKVKSSGSTP